MTKATTKKEVAVNPGPSFGSGLLGHANEARPLITSKGEATVIVAFDCEKAALAHLMPLIGVTTDGAFRVGDLRND